MVLTTKRLIHRPIRMSEAPLYFANSSLPEVNFALGMLPPKSVAHTRRGIRDE